MNNLPSNEPKTTEINCPEKNVSEEKSSESTSTRIDFQSIYVPDDGSGLFWAVAMAYLVPVRNNNNLFDEKFEKLFGLRNENDIAHVQNLFLNHRLSFRYDDNTLNELVTKVFRDRVVDEMSTPESELLLYETVILEDFLYMNNDEFVTDGHFAQQFRIAFPSHCAHHLDLTQLKPDVLNESSIAAMNLELDKVGDIEKIQKFKFHSYLNSMRSSHCCGGQREIRAIQKLLNCQINLFKEQNANKILFKDNNNMICLSNLNGVQYEFNVVKIETIIELIKNANYEMVAYLIKIGVDRVNNQDDIGWTLLHYAVLTDNYKDIINHLFNQGANLNIRNNDNRTPFQLATHLNLNNSISAFISIRLMAIKKNIRIKIQDAYHNTEGDDILKLHPMSLSAAALSKDFEWVKCVLKVRSKGSEFEGLTYLHHAAFIDSLDLVKILIEEGKTDVNAKAANGWTPLHMAAGKGHSHVAKYLIQSGADVNAKDLIGVLPIALMVGNDHLVDYLVEKGAEVNSLDANGMSPLHYAVVKEGNAVQILVEHGAAINIVHNTGNGGTPLIVATYIGNWDIVRYLLENGALLIGLSEEVKKDIYQRFIENVNKDYRVHHAIALGNVELLEKLIQSLSLENKALFEIYAELKLNDVKLSSEICTFVENKLMDFIFYSDRKVSDELSKGKTDVKNVKRRVLLLISGIDKLLDCFSDDKYVNDTFIFVGKFIARNMHVLKQSYLIREALPWEEMQFCLISYLLSYTNPVTVDISVNLVLHNQKIMHYLLLFKIELLKLDFDNINSGKILIDRDWIKTEFKDLYTDFERLKDVHSLMKIESHLKVVCAVDLDKRAETGKLVLERALQVIGECLKNTPDTPNLSDAVYENLVDFAPFNTKNSVATLRDALSHIDHIKKKFDAKNDKTINFFKTIRTDLLNLRIGFICTLFNKKIQIAKQFFETISRETYADLCAIVGEIRVNCDLVRNQDPIITISDEAYPFLQNAKNYVAELRNQKAEGDGESLEELEKIIGSIRGSFKFMQKKYAHVLSDISEIIDQVGKKNNLRRITEKINEILNWFPQCCLEQSSFNRELSQLFYKLQKPFQATNSKKNRQFLKRITADYIYIRKNSGIDDFKFTVCEPEKSFFDVLEKIDDRCKHFLDKFALNSEWQNPEYESTKEIFLAKCELIKFYKQKPFLSIHISEYKTLMEKINFKIYKKENMVSLYEENDPEKCQRIIWRIKPKSDKSFEKYDLIFLFFENLELLENILDLKKSDSELLNALRTNDELRLATTMLMLILTEVLNDDNFSYFEPNKTFLDEALPVLIGRNLRNYLAHGDLLVDLLSIDPLKSIIYHARAMQKNCCKSELRIYNNLENRIGKETIEDFDKLENQFHQSLHLLGKKEALTKAVRENNKSSFKKLIVSGLELKYRYVNDWILLFYAIKTKNLKLIKMLVNADLINIYHRDQLGYSLIYYVIKNKNIALLKFLMEHYDISPNVSLHSGKSLLHLSVQFGYIKFIEWLLSIGADKNVIDDDGNTLIDLASKNDNNCASVMLALSDLSENDVVNDLGTEDKNSTLPTRILYFKDVLKITTDESDDEIENAEKILMALRLDKNQLQKFKNMIKNKTFNSTENFNHLAGVIDISNTSKLLYLYTACLKGDLKLVKTLIESMPIDKVAGLVNSRYEDGKTVLHTAALYGHKEVMKYLLDNAAADINIPTTNNGDSVLHQAVLRGDESIFEMLIERGADVNARNKRDETLLHSASRHGKYKVVEVLLVKGASDVNAVSEYHNCQSSLHFAVDANCAKTVQILLNNEADVHAVGDDGTTALHNASHADRIEIAKILLHHGANINAQDNQGYTPLHLAIYNNKKKAVAFLLEHKADVNISDNNGDTTLHFVVKTGHIGILNLLIENGAVFNKNKNGETPLYLAIMNRHVEIVEALMNKYQHEAYDEAIDKRSLLRAAGQGNIEIISTLLKHGFNVDLTDGNNLTALHLAADAGHFAIVEKLLGANAKCDARVLFGFTAIHLAANKGHANIIKLFLSFDESAIDFETDNGDTPLHLASPGGHIDAVKLLLENGAKVNAENQQHMSSFYCAVAGLSLLEKNTDFNALAQSGHAAVVSILLENGANFNAGFCDASCLHLAVRDGHTGVAEVLLKNGACVDALDGDNLTALHWAAINGKHEMIAVLREYEANLNARNNDGCTPLHLAATNAHLNVAEKLINHGADVFAINNHDSVLHRAVRNAEILKLVLVEIRNQCDGDTGRLVSVMNAPDTEGDTPLMWTAESGYSSSTPLLLECDEIDINKQNLKGFTALHWAVQNGHQNIAELLITKKANVNIRDNNGKSALDLTSLKIAEKETNEVIAA